MELLPHPLFASARILDDCEFSASSQVRVLVTAFLSKLDPALQPFEIHELAYDFLADRRELPSYESCRTAIERLILWALLIRGKSVFTLDRADAFEFIWFVQEPPDSWICEKAPLRFRNEISNSGLKTITPNPKWRPFAKGRLPTEPSSLYKTLTECSAFFSYLVKTSNSLRNPFAELISQASKTEVATPLIELTLASNHWAEILSAAERLAVANPRMHERTVFVVAAQAYLNVACSDFFDSKGNIITLGSFVHNEGTWLLRLDSGDITVPDDFIQRYFLRVCDFQGLYPQNEGSRPIISKINGSGQLTRRTLVKITKDAVREALRHMESNGASGAKMQSLHDAYKVWLYSIAPGPKRSQPPAISEVSPDSDKMPRPLFADYLEVIRSDGSVNDHPDTLLYLASCSEAARPREAYEHAKEYLYGFRNRNTYEAYRKYVERLLLWTYIIKRKPIYELSEIDLHEFNEFCKSPPKDWIRTSYERRFTKVRAGSYSRGAVLTVANLNWRPFWIAGKCGEDLKDLSYHSSIENSAGQLTVARSFFDFLLSKQAVDYNPLLNLDSFAHYSHRRRATPKLQQGASEAEFQKVIDGAFTLLKGWDLLKMLFLIYTVNELKLSRSDIKSFGSLLRFDCLDASNGAWTASLPGKKGTRRSLLVSSRYVQEVFLPYRMFLQKNNVSPIDRCPLFSGRVIGVAVSDSWVSKLLVEVCRAAAEDMQCSGESAHFTATVRSITIGILANSCKPSEYRFKEALHFM
ncbi:hypothetical protein LOY42_12995 [Pseudomonas sp. B21-023]|uniref:hypothetical protein n=1 Tax=Pseudomonas sp. B21-023 TaxID=2895477 RepID=UPI002160CA1D|nr:hypothetical protein [Pseudomonas sp. B21-023]UVM19171.1 hypothetical protein LOY42_12995 [Pseudomonas sp. B21-023]